jgi:hypothetical protein
MKRVTWEIDNSPMPDSPFCDDFYKELENYKGEPYWITHYNGEIIGISRSFFGTTYLIVACDDGKIRTICAGKVKIINNNNK